MRSLFLKLRPALYWGLPVLILYLILRQLDFALLLALAKGANPLLIALGVGLSVLAILSGALRWHLLARGYDCTRLTAGQSVKEYWLSLAMSMLAPGSLGSDVYRVALVGRQAGRYLESAFIIVVEKGAALLSCALLVASIYPFLTFAHLSAEFEIAIDLAYSAALLGLVFLALLALMHKNPLLGRLGAVFWRRAGQLANKAIKALPGRSARFNTFSARPGELIKPLFSARIAFPTVAFSLAIHVIGATQAQIFLQALGYDLPFLANLFIAPLLILVMNLPITVGGIGVREAAYVLFYGAFGVPMETALLVGFCFLLSTLTMAYGIGGMLFLVRKSSSHNCSEIPQSIREHIDR